MVGRKALKIKTFLADARMRLQIDEEAQPKKGREIRHAPSFGIN